MIVYKGKFVCTLDNIPPKVKVDGLLYYVRHLIDVSKKSEENHSELGAVFLLNIIFNKISTVSTSVLCLKSFMYCEINFMYF